MTTYSFTKTPVSIDRLTQEIQNSSITIAIDYITLFGSDLQISFKSDLSTEEQTTLSTLVTNHSGLPLPQNTNVPVEVKIQPEQQPFAQPTFRTKRDALASPVSCAINTATDISFKMTEERYVSGGALIVSGAEFGDWIEASVEDPDGIIPSIARPSICENWPTVSRYIDKAFVEVANGSISVHKIDTYPLNAKIPINLYLSVKYHAVNSGSARSVAVNYTLTKKL